MLKSIQRWFWSMELVGLLLASISVNVVQHLITEKHIEINTLLVEEVKLQDEHIVDLTRYKKGYVHITTAIGLSVEEQATLLDVINSLE